MIGDIFSRRKTDLKMWGGERPYGTGSIPTIWDGQSPYAVERDTAGGRVIPKEYYVDARSTIPYGWQCPVCKNVYSPSNLVCWECNQKTTIKEK